MFFTRNLLQSEPINFKGDPMQDFALLRSVVWSLTSFFSIKPHLTLDFWSAFHTRIPKRLRLKRSSTRMAALQCRSICIRCIIVQPHNNCLQRTVAPSKQLPINSALFAQQREDKVSPQDIFFYRLATFQLHMQSHLIVCQLQVLLAEEAKEQKQAS